MLDNRMVIWNVVRCTSLCRLIIFRFILKLHASFQKKDALATQHEKLAAKAVAILTTVHQYASLYPPGFFRRWRHRTRQLYKLSVNVLLPFHEFMGLLHNLILEGTEGNNSDTKRWVGKTLERVLGKGDTFWNWAITWKRRKIRKTSRAKHRNWNDLNNGAKIRKSPLTTCQLLQYPHLVLLCIFLQICEKRNYHKISDTWIL